MHPDAAAAATDAARRALRGGNPQVYTLPSDDYLKYHGYVKTVAGRVPGSAQVGLDEEPLEAFILNLAMPTGFRDAGGTRDLTLMKDTLLPAAADRLWRRAVIDGFDISIPAKSPGEALQQLRQWIDDVDPDHSDYQVDANDFQEAEAASSRGRERLAVHEVASKSVNPRNSPNFCAPGCVK